MKRDKETSFLKVNTIGRLRSRMKKRRKKKKKAVKILAAKKPVGLVCRKWEREAGIQEEGTRQLKSKTKKSRIELVNGQLRKKKWLDKNI